MIQSFGEALGFIAQKPGVYIVVVLLALIGAGFALTQTDTTNLLLESGDFETLFSSSTPLELVLFAITIAVGLIVSTASALYVAQQAYHWKTKQKEKSSIGLVRATGITAALLILIFGMIGLWLWLLSIVTAFIGFLGFFVIGVSVLIVAYIIFKFTFAIPLIGFGFGIEKAMRESWRITGKHLIATIGIIIGLFLVGFVYEMIAEAVVDPLEEELMANVIAILLSAALSMYTFAVLALAIPLNELEEIPRTRHTHGIGAKR